MTPDLAKICSHDHYHIPEFLVLNQSGLGLKATKVVSNSTCMLVDIIYKRAKPPTYLCGPQMRVQGAAFSSKPSCRVVPKKEVTINLINLCGELAMLALHLR